jgi:hypothetical protein
MLLTNRYPLVVLPIKRHLQREEYTCGPASLRILLETLQPKEILLTEAQLGVLCGTNSKTGTDPERMIQVLAELGVEHTVHESATQTTLERCLRQFALCLVDYQAHDDGSGDGHYSVIFGFDETHFFIADPYKKKGTRNKEWGFRKMRKDLFVKRWYARYDHNARVTHWLVSVPIAKKGILK